MTLFERVHVPSFAGATEWLNPSHSALPSFRAMYFVDADGIVRGHHYGEGRYDNSERMIQRLLGVDREPVSVNGLGVEAEADWDHLRTSETYLGAARGAGRVHEHPEHLRLNHWTVTGEWTIGRESVALDQAGGSIAFQFHARDAHVVLSTGARPPIPFRVLLDGEAPGLSHDAIRERTLEIAFLEPGAEAYSFTFG